MNWRFPIKSIAGVCCCASAMLVAGTLGCRDPESKAASASGGIATSRENQSVKSERSKIGVLLVSHGSPSAEWREMLTDFSRSVTPELLSLDRVDGVKTAFMEYTEPSIATSLRQFDQEGFHHVILVPLLLTVSSHSFDDIPTIVGQKSDAKTLLALETEKIERYTPQARVTITPLLDFSTLLETNLQRRITALSRDPAQEGVVLVAYGDGVYQNEWESFFTKVGQAVQIKTGVAEVVHCWCGHIVEYSGLPTQDAIRRVLSRHERAIVVPVLVARDKNFQERIIGGAVDKLGAGGRVVYVPDAILPEPTLNQWVVSISRDTCRQLLDRTLPAQDRTP